MVLWALTGILQAPGIPVHAKDCLSINPSVSEVVLNPGPAVKLPGNGDTLDIPCSKSVVNFFIALKFTGNTEKYFEDSTKLVATLYYNNLTFIMVYDAQANLFRLLNNQSFLGPGTYNLLITAQNCIPWGAPCDNCTATYSFDVRYDTDSVLPVSISTDPDPPVLTCKPGSSVTLKGTPPLNGLFLSQWARLIGNQFVPISGATNPEYVATLAGTYQYQLKGPSGCVGVNIMAVNPPQVPVISIAPSPQILMACLQAISGVSVSNSGGGNSNLNFAWSTSGSGIIESGANTPVPVVSAPGTYYLLVTRKDNECSVKDSVRIDPGVVPTVLVDIKKDPDTNLLSCATTHIKLDASATLSSGVSVFTFKWSTGAGPAILVNTPGTYSVTATATDIGCQGVATISILQDIAKPAVQIVAPRDTICIGESVVLTALTPEPVDFLWNDHSVMNTNTVTPPLDGPNWYSVTVTALDNGCTNAASKWIERLKVPELACISASYSIVNNSLLTIGCDAYGDQLRWLATAVNVYGIEPSGEGPLQAQTYSLIEKQAPGRVEYAFFAKNAGCASEQKKVVVNVLPGAEDGIFIPELITPNGDGIHDTWEIQVPETIGNRDAYTLLLYNRNGSEVYRGTLAAPFDAQHYPDGTYFYVLAKPAGGEIRGAVTILRRQ